MCIIRFLYQYYKAYKRPLNPTVETIQLNIKQTLMLN
jgi:hypothetical protein